MRRLWPLFLMTACAHNYYHPYPELVEKTFDPRGGVIEHVPPQTGEEQRQYQLAVVDIAKKYCKTPFKILSESRVSEITGASTTGAASPFNTYHQHTEFDKEAKVRVAFKCLPNPVAK